MFSCTFIYYSSFEDEEDRGVKSYKLTGNKLAKRDVINDKLTYNNW